MKPLIHGLYAVIDNSFTPKYSHAELAHMVLLGGGRIIQLRMKDAAGYDAIFRTAREIMTLKKKFDFAFIINDLVDIAGEVNADGVHLGLTDMPVASARKILGDDKIIGASTHNLEEALVAKLAGADYLAFGAIFSTKAKGPNHPIQGLERLKKYCSDVPRPVVAIGGINRTNINDVIDCGVNAIAMIRGLTEAIDVVEETRWYVKKLSQCPTY